jgi:hypothetical protein
MRSRIAAALTSLLLAIGLAGVMASPAQANAACTNDYLCTYQCYLASSCSYTARISSATTGCIKINWSILSVKNESSHNYRVWKNSFCQNGGKAWYYAETDGDMNWEWAGYVAASIRRDG